ncbi:MAG: alpha/beta hydrolase [Aeromicrobium sp.]
MSKTVKLATTVGAFVAAGVAAKTLNERQRTARLNRRGEDLRFGSIRSAAQTVHATDGLALHVEVDEGPAGPTIVFVHGWTCTLDSWHYQRASLRGAARMVFMDQRSHGRSGRSYDHNSSLEQLADDLRVVLEKFAPSGDIVLVGHSMGAMAIMALAASHPELFGTRVNGVVLCATAAGDLLKGNNALKAVRPIIVRVSSILDRGRAFNSYSVVRRWGLGPNAQERHVNMTNEMILATPTNVIIDFYQNFATLDLYDSLETLGRAKTVVIGGTKDMLTPFRHSRRLAESIPGATLVALDDVGHMVMFEDHDKVTEVIAGVYESIS